MNPLHKARDGATSAWRGTARTATWVKDGVGGAFGGARSKVAGLRSGGDDAGEAEGSKDPGPIRDGLAGAWDRVGGASLMTRARSDSRVGAALIVGAIVFVLWIAWTVYVWTENGATAGIGVLITWPAVLAALALVAAPFVGAVALVKRLAADGGPSLAIAGGGTTDAVEVEAEEAEDEESEDEEKPAGEGGGDSEDDAGSEDDQADSDAEKGA